MADKSTKTDDALLNGDLDSVASLSCPTTTNAATMTTTVVQTETVAISRSTASAQVVGSNAQQKSHHSHVPSLHRQDSRQPQPPSPPPMVSTNSSKNDITTLRPKNVTHQGDVILN